MTGSPPDRPADRPSGHTSVMASRASAASGLGAPGDLDYFPTPPWAARAGGELIQRLDPGPWSCWEPACGGGHMAHALADYFEAGVLATDIFDYGYGGLRDFLAAPLVEPPAIDWIVTNPPFIQGEAFVRHAWPRARRGVAMLLRSVFLEGVGRHRLHYGDTPLAAMAQFAERVPMVKGRWDPEASSATAYAWFVWIKPAALEDTPMGTAIATAQAAGGWLGLGIAPGAKARLTRDSDRRFLSTDADLFDGAGE